MTKDIVNVVKTPSKLMNHSKNFDFEIKELETEKIGLFKQIQAQKEEKERLLNMPEFNQNLKTLMDQANAEKERFKSL